MIWLCVIGLLIGEALVWTIFPSLIIKYLGTEYIFSESAIGEEKLFFKQKLFELGTPILSATSFHLLRFSSTEIKSVTNFLYSDFFII